jgi:hypothetical protein
VCIALPAVVSPAWGQENAEEKKRRSEVDESITRALAFLEHEQQPAGSWYVDSVGEATSSTSLAVMAFMSAGHTPGEGPFGELINRGIRWVLAHQEQNGMLVHKTSHGPMYCHGISSLMLAEAAGMMDENDSADVRRALERAIRLILDAQKVKKDHRHVGGWRYHPSSSDSDLSVTGWQLLALRAAKDIGCDVPVEAIEAAVEYVKMCSYGDNVGFGYQPKGGPTPTRTGTGILCLEICGAHHTAHALGGAKFLLKSPLKYEDSYFFYGAYYCGIGMFKMGGEYWDQTRPSLSRQLLKHQNADGSWLADNSEERRHGKVYCTTMAILSLAVEYQYLPIYQR